MTSNLERISQLRVLLEEEVIKIYSLLASDEVGYYVEPTILPTKDPKAPTMVQELFGPVLTIYVYPENKVDETLELADSTSPYALTCGL